MKKRPRNQTLFVFYCDVFCVGLHGGEVVSALGFESQLGAFREEFACSHALQLPPPKTCFIGRLGILNSP